MLSLGVGIFPAVVLEWGWLWSNLPWNVGCEAGVINISALKVIKEQSSSKCNTESLIVQISALGINEAGDRKPD